MSLSQNAMTENGAAASDLGISRGSLTSIYALSGAEVDRGFMVGDGYTLVTDAATAKRCRAALNMRGENAAPKRVRTVSYAGSPSSMPRAVRKSAVAKPSVNRS
jgi:hypothetical protein